MKKRRFGRKMKRGASLMVVLISITVLVIMGTLFTVIAMRSYNYSYSKMCKQQAYYTAVSAIQILYGNINSDVNVLTNIMGDLDDAIEANPAADISTIAVEVGEVGGSSAADGSINEHGTFASLMGKCTLKARYTSEKKDEISLEAHATYNGYTSTARALVARTSKAAAELKKIFDNTFCLQSPISPIIAAETIGDIYISSPGAYDRDANGNIINSTANATARDSIYGAIQPGVVSSAKTVHTKPVDIDNTPLTDTAGNTYYNDWVELYMFSNYGTSLNTQYPRNYTAVNGDVYAQSRVLIGMWDKDATDLKHFNTWNFEKLRREYREVSADYEHGNSDFETLFDHDDDDKVPVGTSTFRINGDVWLWEDARIENFDSTKTYNAYKGVKNNIYAMQDLYIDGYCYQGNDKDNFYASNQVSIFGDVMVQGELYIANAVVFGDIYCNGSRLTMVDCKVYGNVYFAGGEFTAENTRIQSGTYNRSTVPNADEEPVMPSTYQGKSVSYDMPGGNLVIMNGANGNNPFLPAETTRGYGAVLTNCSVTGTLYANTSVRLVVSEYTKEGALWDRYNTYPDSTYGNVIAVNQSVGIDLTRTYEEGYSLAVGSSRNAAAYNKIKINGVLMAYSLDLRYSQFKGNDIDWYDWTGVERLFPKQSYIKTAVIGSGTLFIDGNQRNTRDGDKSILIDNLYYCGSNCKIYDTRISGYYYGASGISEGSNNSITASSGVLGSASAVLAQARNNGALGNAATATFDSAYSAYFAVAVSPFATYAHNGFSLKAANGAQRDITTWDEYGFPAEQEWSDKVISLKNWSAPKAAESSDNIDITKVYYYQYSNVNDLVNQINNPNSTTVKEDVAAFVNGVLTIKKSIEFTGKADFSAYQTVVFDNSAGNLHIKFNRGAVFGTTKDSGKTYTDKDASRVLLQGGNMTFFYLYSLQGEGGHYNFDNPELYINPFTVIGEASEYESAFQVNDLYIISNDDIIMEFGKDVSFNGFVYAPKGHLYIEPGTENMYWSTLNGCMAIESYILDAVEGKFSWWDKLWSKEWEQIVEQYTKCVYNYVQPRLIVDVGLQYGDTTQDIADFSQVVWEFLGYY